MSMGCNIIEHPEYYYFFFFLRQGATIVIVEEHTFLKQGINHIILSDKEIWTVQKLAHFIASVSFYMIRSKTNTPLSTSPFVFQYLKLDGSV